MATQINDSQCKKCRRAGEKLFLKGDRCSSPKCAMVKRPFAPGEHGEQRMKKLTKFGQQLIEKQKAKRAYGLREKQFRNYFEKALKKAGNTGEWLFRFLEGRLDNTVYRLGFATSRRTARQIVSHKHIMVNGKKVNIPSYQVKIGDEISLTEKSAKSPMFTDLSQKLKNNDSIASWLIVDADKIEGKVTGEPKLEDMAMAIDWRAIIEFYSK